mgnify:CR=1 FL=1
MSDNIADKVVVITNASQPKNVDVNETLFRPTNQEL